MCGIFAFLNNNNQCTKKYIEEQFQKGRSRGPEYSKLTTSMIQIDFGFHRLAINGLNDRSNQPIVYKDMSIICNGEIYNYRELYHHLGTTPTTDSDCEVILHLYEKYDIEKTLQLLDGVFSFILIDYRFDKTVSKVFVARDPYGVRPLYQLYSKDIDYDYEHPFVFASEIKQLTDLKQKLDRSGENMVIEHVEPGTYSTFELPFKVSPYWSFCETKRYHTTPFCSFYENAKSGEHYDMNRIAADIQYHFGNAIEKRCCTTERPIACLLSGGLDSSLVAALVNEYHIRNRLPTIETYSIGLSGSTDLAYARTVANYLGTKHTEIVLSEAAFLEKIPEVIYAIESYDTTTVRASIGNWLLGQYIAGNSEAKVIFNGDGADELAGGYLYMRHAGGELEFDQECRRLLKEIHQFDVLRSDRCIASHGLEPRTPFLDRAWVQYYLSLPAKIRFHGNSEEKQMEKYLIRNAFSSAYYTNSRGGDLLPESVLWRKKEAFSDGVSRQSRSLYEIVQEHADRLLDVDVVREKWNFGRHLPPANKEQYYYRRIFESHFEGAENTVPYFWMPKYVEAKDASARTLACYHEEEEEELSI